MSADEIPEKYRLAEFFSHIDMGFLNRRLAITALGPIRDVFLEQHRPSEDHMTVLANDHLLVTMLIDVCSEIKTPTLAEALTLGKPKHLFMSIERLEPCPEMTLPSGARATMSVKAERSIQNSPRSRLPPQGAPAYAVLHGMARRSPPRKVIYFEPVPPRLAATP